MQELPVAVIDDVEKIKRLLLALHGPRIVPKPIYQLVSIEEFASRRLVA
jgi:hypothetical protein